jgi:SAM-dependent methyltransferase
MSNPFPPAVVGMSAREIFQSLMATHFHQPAICLWRTLELLEMKEIMFSAPVLDLGCGNGDVGEIALRSHWPIFGLDRVHSETRAARVREAYQGLTTADATALPFPDEVFGSVVSICVLEHIPDDALVLQEIARVLKPGGSFIFSTPSDAFEANLLGFDEPERVAAVNERLGHYHYRGLDEWTGLLGKEGLIVDRHKYLLPYRSQRVWERLDNLMIARLWGRRLLDIVRGLERRQLLPKKIWAYVWAIAISKLALMRVEDDESGGGQMIVAHRKDASGTTGPA